MVGRYELYTDSIDLPWPKLTDQLKHFSEHCYSDHNQSYCTHACRCRLYIARCHKPGEKCRHLSSQYDASFGDFCPDRTTHAHTNG